MAAWRTALQPTMQLIPFILLMTAAGLGARWLRTPGDLGPESSVCPICGQRESHKTGCPRR
jgi:hypothetical protein